MIARSKGRRASNRWTLRAAFVLVALTTPSLLGDTPSERIDFLRIGVPKGRLTELGLKALPVNRIDFEKRIQELNAKYRAMTDPVGTRIISSVYNARLVGDSLVDGRGELRIKHALPEPGYVSFEPLGLAVQALRWRDNENRPVEAGRASGRDLVVAVEKDDTLEFDWSLRGYRDRESVLQFDLSLPNAAINELILDVPDTHRPRSSHGIVTHLPADGRSSTDTPASDAFERWRIELGANTKATIQIVTNDRADETKPFVLVHSAKSYALDASGLEFHEILTLTTTDRAVQRLTLDADAGLRVGTVTVDGQPVDLAKRESGPDQEQIYDLAFREPISGKAELLVTAFARVVFDEPWTLPSTTLRDVLWSAGTMRLEVGDTNLVRRMRNTGSRLRLTGPLPAPRQGDSFDFDLLRPDGSCEVVVRRIEQKKSGRLFTSIRFGDSNVTARVTAELSSVGQPAFSFLLRRDPVWAIDSIESIPADALQGQSVRGPSGQIREIRLAQPATSETPVRIVVRARRSLPADGELRGRDLRPFVMADALQQSSITALATEVPLQLETSADAHLERVAAQSLSATDREFFAPEESSFVYLDGPEADGLRAAAVRTSPRVNSRAEINATVESEAVRVEYVLQCEPVASQLTELQVRFSAPIPGAIHWTIVGERTGAVRARRADTAGQTWELTLARPRKVSFDLKATATIPLTDAFLIPLVSLPQADTQSGTLIIGTNDGTQLAIEQRGLKAIPIDPAGNRKHTQTQAAFRYTPSQDVFVGAQPIAAGNSHKTWVQRGKLTSRLDASGHIAHDLQLHIQNFNANHFTLELPPDAFGRQIVIGERSLLWPPEEARVTVPLPRDVTLVTVRLRYDQQVRRGVAFTKLQPLLPILSVPCLDWMWSVWLPPGVEATRDSRLTAGQHPEEASWDQRLFGYSLLRRSGKPWSIVEPATWPSIPGNSDDNNAAQSAKRCLANMDASLRQNGLSDDALTWGKLLRSVAQSESADYRLWIDKDGLSEAGISIDTRPPDPSANASAVSLLRRAHLLLVATPRGVVLTTIMRQSQGTFGLCVEGGDQVLSSRTSPDTAQLVAADSWLRAPANSDGALATPSPLDASLVGWTNVSLRVSLDDRTPLTVYEQDKISGLAWGSFFLTLGLVIWLGGRSTAVAFCLGLVAVVATLFVAEPFVLVCRVTFLAVAAGSLILLLRAKAQVAASSQDDSLSIRLGGSAIIATSVLVFVAVLIAMTARHSVAQDSVAQDDLTQTRPDAPVERFSRLFEVYYAIDEDGAPSDNNYHVPVAFSDALKKLEFQLSVARADWLLEACDYSVTLESSTDGVQLRSMQVNCELTTSSADETQITLPLREEEVQVVEVTVDDRYVFHNWSEDGESLELVVKGAKRYRLRIGIHPQVRSEGERQGFDIQAPTLPTSRLAVHGLNEDQVELPNRVGMILPDAVGPGFVAELGSIARLALNWKATTQSVEVAPMINVTQRVWLRPESGVVTLDAVFAFTVVSGRLEHVTLEADPRLRMLPPRESLPIERLGVLRGSRQEITLTLDRAYRSGETVMLPLSFVLPRDSGALTLSGPLVRPRDMAPNNSSIGVSSRTGLLAELTAPNSTEIEGSEFASAWGIMQTPDQALQLVNTATDWTLRLSQQTPVITTVEETELVVGRRHASIDYRADIDVTGYPTLKIELQTPPTFQSSDLQIVQEDLDVVRRWFTDGQGVTTVLLSRPLSEAARVTLTGSMNLQNRERLAFAGLRIGAAQTAARTVRILRKPQVLLEVTSHPSYESLEVGSMAQPLPQSDRPVATMQERDADQARPIVLQVQPNPAVFSGSLSTTLRPDATGWRVEADLSLQVTSGVLDVLRWKLPRELADGVSIDPPYPREVQDVPGQAEVLLVVTLHDPVAGKLDLHLRAPLVSADGGRVSAPNIEVLDARRMVRSLVLPLHSGQEEIAWDTRGLERPVRNDQNTTYLVSGGRMRATIRDARHATGTPRVLLADTRIEWRRDGRYAGLIYFDLAPGGDSSCELRVPPGVKIVHLQTAGLTSSMPDAGSLDASGGILRVPLAIEQLPQRLAVVFTGHASPVSDHSKGKYLQAPSVENFDIDKTLWTIYRVNVDDRHQPLLTHAIRTTPQMRTVRNQQIQAVLQRGAQVSSQHRTDDFVTWRTAWTQRLKQTEPGNVATAEQLRSEGLGYLASSFGAIRAGTIQCELGGAASSIVFIEPSAVSRSLLRRMLVAFAIASSLILLFLARSWQPLWDFLATWPHLAGVAFGLVWWLWLTPSVVGWVIVAVSLLSVVRPAVSARSA